MLIVTTLKKVIIEHHMSEEYPQGGLIVMGTKENNNIKNKSTSAVSSPPIKIPSYAWKVLAVLSLVATMVMYAETMLIPAIPDLIKDFGTSYSMSSWILTAYLVSVMQRL